MNAPYLVIPIGLVLLIMYSISLLFSRLDVISRPVHRRIWNYLLLATFLVAAVLGILMAVQVNYRMEVPWTEKVLKWHVNFGLAMSVTGIFHFLWHWQYYFPSKAGRLKSAERAGTSSEDLPAKENPLFPPLRMFITGFAGITFQTFMIRELLGLFQGNELMISLILFIWLLITGAGALTGSRSRKGLAAEAGYDRRKADILILTLVLLSLITLPLLYFCKSLFFAPGIEAGPLAFSAFLLLILAPFCFLNGFAFTFMSRLMQPSGMTIRKAYAWESFGGAAAGVVCTLLILAGLFTPPAGRMIEKLFHPNDVIIATRSGPSGRITITGNGEQVSIFENGLLAQSSGNTLQCEEMSHFTMTRHPDPRKVLVIGGLLSGVTTELKKYRCERIDLAEPDPRIFTMAMRLNLIPEDDTTCNYIRTGLSGWLNRHDTRYDVILVMLPGPHTLSLNRFYTAGFFARLKNSLATGGIISVMLPGTANYVSEEAVATIGPVMNAMRRSYPGCRLLPGENTYLVAGDNIPEVNVLTELKSRGISTLYISDGYFDENRFRARKDQVNEIVSSSGAINTDLMPRAYFGQIAWWLGQFPSHMLWPLAVILALLVTVSLLTRNAAYTGMFIMGAGASGIEIILLFLMQVTAGSLYLFTGLLLAVFMAGLAAGSSTAVMRRLERAGAGISAILVTFTLVTALTGLLAVWMTGTGGLNGLKTALVLLMTLILAMLTGAFFAHLTTLLPDPRSQGKLYVFDLLGAAFGAIAYPLAVIPIFGLLTGIGAISVSGVLILILLSAGRK
jgi:spermidine synthase